jgi:hypothetical protein
VFLNFTDQTPYNGGSGKYSGSCYASSSNSFGCTQDNRVYLTVILAYHCPSRIGIGVTILGPTHLEGCVAWTNKTIGGTFIGSENSCDCIGSSFGCRFAVSITLIQ